MRKTYGYSTQPRRDILREIDRFNGRLGFALGALSVGGFFLLRKLCELNKEVEKLKKKAE